MLRDLIQQTPPYVVAMLAAVVAVAAWFLIMTMWDQYLHDDPTS